MPRLFCITFESKGQNLCRRVFMYVCNKERERERKGRATEKGKKMEIPCVPCCVFLFLATQSPSWFCTNPGRQWPQWVEPGSQNLRPNLAQSMWHRPRAIQRQTEKGRKWRLGQREMLMESHWVSPSSGDFRSWVKLSIKNGRTHS